MKRTSPLGWHRSASVAVLLFAMLLGSSGEPRISAAAPVQGVSYSGIVTVVFGDPAPDSGQPAKMVFSLDTGRESLELVVSDKVLESAGGLAALVGARVQITGEPSATAGALSLSPALVAQHIVRLPSDGVGQELVSGAHPWVSVLCNFSDTPADTPKSVAYYQSMMANTNPGLNHYWRELSYGIANIDGSTVVGPFVLPNPRSFYLSPRMVRPMLNQLAIDCAQVWRRECVLPHLRRHQLRLQSGLGLLRVGRRQDHDARRHERTWRTTWMPRWANTMAVFSHEMGHGFGLPHSSGPYGQSLRFATGIR